MKVAKTIYHGPYEGLAGAWADFDARIVAQGHTPAESLFETYLTDHTLNPDPDTYLTELTRPIVEQPL